MCPEHKFLESDLHGHKDIILIAISAFCFQFRKLIQISFRMKHPFQSERSRAVLFSVPSSPLLI